MDIYREILHEVVDEFYRMQKVSHLEQVGTRDLWMLWIEPTLYPTGERGTHPEVRPRIQFIKIKED